jgi:hypothetical protein
VEPISNLQTHLKPHYRTEAGEQLSTAYPSQNSELYVRTGRNLLVAYAAGCPMKTLVLATATPLLIVSGLLHLRGVLSTNNIRTSQRSNPDERLQILGISWVAVR